MDATNQANELVIVEGNPPPAGIVVQTVRTLDGTRLRCAVSPSQLDATRGTVILLQGRNEAIEKYFETISDLNRRGYIVVTFDWRGQGGSGRLLRGSNLGHVRHVGQYVGDLECVIQDIVLPDCRGPYAILAHSMGALVALRASARLTNIVERMVLCAPLIAFKRRRMGTRAIHRLAKAARLVGLGRMAVPMRFVPARDMTVANNVLTSDPRRFARNRDLVAAAPQLFLGKPTVSWLAAVTGAMIRLDDSDEIARLAVPTLMICAGGDAVVGTASAERLAWRMRSGSSLTIPLARHELLQEADHYREPLLEAFEAFTATALPLPENAGTKPEAPDDLSIDAADLAIVDDESAVQDIEGLAVQDGRG
ncbi:alpha/beta fold hydrolase [Aurantimonas aggregata]|uniref:Alpha/beta fold hydrolase n=1 Tax=Aurantimonas aggregata TaxID=2047720 RepID=A0A6L9MHS8_9HYPH|nr:alpha/beta hydrolase [Aurantimonas aggregata]NDV87112.1 alpha/beta fold hydrolase [Aurantimonas aggregata]